MRRAALRRAAAGTLPLLVSLSALASDGETPDEIERWVPSVSLGVSVLGQPASGAVEGSPIEGPPLSDGGCEVNGTRTGQLCTQPVPSTQPLSRADRGNDTATAVLPNLSLELMSPLLVERAGRPRLFGHADGSLVFASQRKLAGLDAPGRLALPPPPDSGNIPTDISERTISGQGNRSFLQVQTGLFSAGAGLAFTVEAFDRRIRIKPSFEYLLQEVEFEGLARRAIQLRGDNTSRPTSLDDFRLVSMSARKTELQHGIGGGIEVEADTQRLGPFVASVYLMGRVYHLLGDLDETLCSDRNEIGPSFSPGACDTGAGERVTWTFEPENLVWRGGIGLRFRFLPQ